MNKRILGLAGVVLSLMFSVPALADDAPVGPAMSTTPGATTPTNPPPASGNNYQHQDIHNDAQNYREAMDGNNNANAPMQQGADKEKWREEQKARREHWREEQKARREHWREERKEHHQQMMKGKENHPTNGAFSPQPSVVPQQGVAPQMAAPQGH